LGAIGGVIEATGNAIALLGATGDATNRLGAIGETGNATGDATNRLGAIGETGNATGDAIALLGDIGETGNATDDATNCLGASAVLNASSNVRGDELGDLIGLVLELPPTNGDLTTIIGCVVGISLRFREPRLVFSIRYMGERI